MRFEVDLSGTQEFDAALSQMIAKSSNLAPVMSQVGNYLVGSLGESYDSGTDPYGAGWSPLSPNTRKSGGSILVETGSQRGSLAASPGAQSVEVGFSTSYVQYHQRGTSKMPQRKVVPDSGLPPKDVQPIETIFRQYFVAMFG